MSINLFLYSTSMPEDFTNKLKNDWPYLNLDIEAKSLGDASSCLESIIPNLLIVAYNQLRMRKEDQEAIYKLVSLKRPTIFLTNKAIIDHHQHWLEKFDHLTMVDLNKSHSFEPIFFQKIYQVQEAILEKYDSFAHNDSVFSLFEKVGEAIFVVDASYKIMYLNEKASYITGVSHKQAIGSNVDQVIKLENTVTPVHINRIIESVTKASPYSGLPRFTQLVTQSGAKKYISANVSFVEQDNFSGLMIILRDIHRIMENEMQIRMLSRAIEKSPTAIVITNADSTIQYANDTFESMTGYNFTEVYGQRMHILKSGYTPEDTYKDMWQTISSGQIWHGNLKNRKKDGSFYWESASIAPVIDEHSGRIIQYIAMKQDITLEMNLRETMTQERQNLRTVIDSAPVGIILIDRDLNIMRLNNRVRSMMEAIHPDMSIRDLIINESMLNQATNLYTIESIIHQVLMEREDVDQFDLEWNMPDKPSVWFRINATAIELQNKHFALVAIADLTETKALEKQLEVAMEEAKEADKTKSLFLANMSHEIRTPINGIIGMTELTLESNGLTMEQRENLHMVKYSSNNLLSIINDILDISKIDANKIKLEHIPFNIKEICTNALKSFEYLAKEKGIDLILSLPEDFPEFYMGDPYRIQQILTNILGNAVKFTSDGHVKLSLFITKKPNDQYRLSLEVQDTGIGISQEEQENLFKSFTQGDSSITRKYGGTGLGLTITKKLVTLMDGRLSLNSSKGIGTVFTVVLVLPVATSLIKANTSAPNSDLLANEEKSSHCLVVEDDKVNMTIATEILKKAGFHVDQAINGLMAVEMAKEFAYDFILMDIQLPEMDGATAFEHIRAYYRDKRYIPVVALTAYALKGDRERFLSIGMDAYLAKPYTRQALLQMVEQILSDDYLHLKDLYPSSTLYDMKDELVNLMDELTHSFNGSNYKQAEKAVTKIRDIAKAYALNDFGTQALKLQMQLRKNAYEKATPVLLSMKTMVPDILKHTWL